MPDSSHPLSTRFRKASLAFLYCVAMASAWMQAKFRVVSAAELRLSGSWLRSGTSELSARWLVLVAFAVSFMLALLMVYYLLSRFRSDILMAAVCVLAALGLLGQQISSVRAARAQRTAFLRMVHRLERSAAPGEWVLVENPALLTQLRWYAEEDVRHQLTDAAAAVPSMGGDEALYVGRPGGDAARALGSAGLKLREDGTVPPEVIRTLRTFADDGTNIYFASRP